MVDFAEGIGGLICIPTYNEKENLPLIVPAVSAAVPKAHVLIIDDNSPDGTGDIADALSREDERVHVLHRSDKTGLGKAYLAAFAWGLEKQYTAIVEFDADFSHKPEYLPEMFRRLEMVDVVVGSRRIKGGSVENWGMHRRILSIGGSLYSRMVLGIPVHDLTGGFNGFRRQVLEEIDYQSIESTGYVFQIEIKYRCIRKGFSVEEMPITFPDRVRGVSKMNAGIMGEAMLQVLKLRLSGR